MIREVKEHEEQIEAATQKFKLGNKEIIALVVIGILAVVLIYNTMRITNITAGATGGSITGNSILSSVSASEIIPTGTPKIYGKELGVSYDDISATNQQKAD